MKKLFFIVFLSLFTLNTYARNFICPFTDYFSISAPAGYTMTSILSDGNIIAIPQDLLNFTLQCKEATSTKSGKAYITLSASPCDLCTFHIVDGPYEMNPVVNFVACAGRLKFNGMDHVWGSYTYNLKFSH